MQIRTEQEALFIACEMETTAVQLYTRALQVLESQGREREPLYAQTRDMLADEQRHLCRFRSLYCGLDGAQEHALALSAIGEGVLFEGGLMGAARAGLLSDAPSMLRLAADAERASARKYREFAALAQSGEAREALLMIAAEEDAHLRELEASARRI